MNSSSVIKAVFLSALVSVTSAWAAGPIAAKCSPKEISSVEKLRVLEKAIKENPGASVNNINQVLGCKGEFVASSGDSESYTWSSGFDHSPVITLSIGFYRGAAVRTAITKL